MRRASIQVHPRPINSEDLIQRQIVNDLCSVSHKAFQVYGSIASGIAKDECSNSRHISAGMAVGTGCCPGVYLSSIVMEFQAVEATVEAFVAAWSEAIDK